MTEHKRLTTKEKYPHGAEGVSKDKLTGKYCRGVFEATACVEKLAEYETAEEDGRLVVLLCKVGDTVYVIEDSHIEVFEVNKIELNHKVFGNATYYLEKPSRRGCLYKYYDSEFDDKWFVDREEAEKALDEMEKSD